MQFLYPLFLLSALSLAIPVILHLFYFRRFKKVYFTNVRFLREVMEENSARSRLRNLLALLMRLLALLWLVLAFAQPFFPDTPAQKQGSRAVSIYIDNSFSMGALSQDVPLLEQARARAREVVRSFGPDDQFQVLSNDFSGRQQRLLSQQDALAAIDGIQPSPESRTMSLVLQRQKQALALSRAKIRSAWQISDFQRSAMDIREYADSTLELNLIPLQAVQERNISIDSVWFESPVQMLNQTSPVFVRVRNHSSDPVENIRLSLEYQGQTKPVGVLSIPARATVTDTAMLTILKTGWQEARFSLTDYPIQFDDHYFFSFPVQERIRVLAIHEGSENRYLGAAVRGMPLFELNAQNSQGLEYSRFQEYQLIVLSDLLSYSSGMADELRRYAEEGGNVLLFPAAEANLEGLRSFLRSFSANEPLGFAKINKQASSLNVESFVFKDVFETVNDNLRLPSVQGAYRFQQGSNGEEPLLQFRDGTAMLSGYHIGKGNLYVSAAPLSENYNNLVQSGEIFIPMLYKMAISANNDLRIAYTIGRDELLEAQRQDQKAESVFKMGGPGKLEFIPEQRSAGNTLFLGMGGQVREAGQYSLYLNPGNILHTFSFNYDRRESVMDYVGSDELAALAGPMAKIIQAKNETVLAAQIEERGRGNTLWRWCLLAALLFLAAEATILRLWK
ncbi:MAG: hypothetical protein RL181_2831 [Bacteroidota bacterium]